MAKRALQVHYSSDFYVVGEPLQLTASHVHEVSSLRNSSKQPTTKPTSARKKWWHGKRTQQEEPLLEEQDSIM